MARARACLREAFKNACGREAKGFKLKPVSVGTGIVS